MQSTVNLGRKLRVLALCSVAIFATAAMAQNTVITADKMIDVLTGKVIDNPAIFAVPTAASPALPTRAQ